MNGEYQPIEVDTDEDGVLRGHSDALSLDICARGELELRLYDPANGEWLRSHQDPKNASAGWKRRCACTASRLPTTTRAALTELRPRRL